MTQTNREYVRNPYFYDHVFAFHEKHDSNFTSNKFYLIHKYDTRGNGTLKLSTKRQASKFRMGKGLVYRSQVLKHDQERLQKPL